MLLGAVGFVLAVGEYDVGAYLWLEGIFVFGTIVLAVAFFSARCAPAARTGRTRCSVGCGSSVPMRAFYDGVHHYRSRPRLLARRVRVHGGAAGRARAGAVGRRARGRDRARPAHLLRDGAAVLPRPARPLHAQRDRGTRGVLRQLPRCGRGRCRPGVRGRVPLLRRHARARRSRRRDPPAGRASAATPASGPSMADVAAVVVTYDALPWIEQCLESVRGVPSSSSTTGPPTAPWTSCGRRSPSRRGRAGEPGPRCRVEPRHRGDRGPLRPRPQRRRVAARGRAGDARGVRRRPSCGGGRWARSC